MTSWRRIKSYKYIIIWSYGIIVYYKLYYTVLYKLPRFYNAYGTGGSTMIFFILEPSVFIPRGGHSRTFQLEGIKFQHPMCTPHCFSFPASFVGYSKTAMVGICMLDMYAHVKNIMDISIHGGFKRVTHFIIQVIISQWRWHCIESFFVACGCTLFGHD